MNEDLKDANLDNSSTEYKDETVDWKALLFKCILHWPWFVISLAICIVCAWTYLHYATPIFKTTASVLIKEEDKKSSSRAMNGLANMSQLGIFSSSKNFDNEIEVLKSKSLIKNTVEDLNLNTSYFVKRGFKKIELYSHRFFDVVLPPIYSESLPGSIKMETVYHPDGSLEVKSVIRDKTYQKHFYALPGLMPTPYGTFYFKQAAKAIRLRVPYKITVILRNPVKVAESYSARLDVSPSSKTTTIALLSFTDSKKSRGVDFLNKLVEVYNTNANDDKNEIAKKTREFIDQRIKIINDDLFNTEKDLENFKRQSGLTDLKSDAELAIQQSSEYNKMQAENTTKLNIIKYLRRA